MERCRQAGWTAVPPSGPARRAAVDKVAVEAVEVLVRRPAVGAEDEEQVRQLAVQVAHNDDALARLEAHLKRTWRRRCKRRRRR